MFYAEDLKIYAQENTISDTVYIIPKITVVIE